MTLGLWKVSLAACLEELGWETSSPRQGLTVITQHGTRRSWTQVVAGGTF